MSQDQIEAAAATAQRFADGNGRVALELSEHGDTAVVRLHGNVDATLTRSLRDSLTWAVHHHPTVVVDLSAACAVDRSALVALARAHRRATALGAAICLVEPTRAVHAAIRAARLDDLLAVFDSVADAVAALGVRGDHGLVSTAGSIR